MKFLSALSVVLIAATACIPASAQTPAAAAAAVVAPADKPTTASIEKLLHVMKADEMMLAMQKNMRAVLDRMYSDPNVVGDLTPEKKAAIGKLEDKMMTNMSELLSWDNVKEITVNAYQSAFSQKEVDAITVFYQTPEGQSIVTKLPIVMQSAMIQMQGKLQPMMQKIMAEARQEAAQLKAGNLAVDPSKPAPASPAGT